MRLNEHVQIVGEKVILVPYEAKHVERYNEWMQSEELQSLTASEPLTLQQEYDMQQSWRIDNDKCTFLILDKARFESTGNEIDSLIGDTNLFILPDDDDDENVDHPALRTAEAEIMIANPDARGKRFGWESILLMLAYGQAHVRCERFVAKVGCSNVHSINMFERMQFLEVSRSKVFDEVTLERLCTPEWLAWLASNVTYEIKPYGGENEV